MIYLYNCHNLFGSYLICIRLMTPEPTQKLGMFPRLGSRFRYSGRTHYESKKTPIERPAPKFQRSLSGRTLTSRSMDSKNFFILFCIL